MKRKICLIILILFFYSLQGTFCKAISLGGISPNIMLLIPVCFGYFKGREEGMFAGVISGLLFDLYYAQIYGFSILAFCYAGYIAGIFNREYNERRIIIPLAATGISEFLYEFLVYVGGFLLHNKLDVAFYTAKIILPSAIYTMLACFLLFHPLRICSGLFEYREKRKVSDYVKGND
jgi:rod shape-determining protein MreD